MNWSLPSRGPRYNSDVSGRGQLAGSGKPEVGSEPLEPEAEPYLNGSGSEFAVICSCSHFWNSSAV